MTAAHELIERGFAVTLFERRELLGGKARSMPVAGSGAGWHRELPGEHGFRFFPDFYRHLRHTMRRIPFGNQPRGVLDNLVPATRSLLVGSPFGQVGFPNRLPRSWREARTVLADLAASPGKASDLAGIVPRFVAFLTSCAERREHEYDHVDWTSFLAMEGQSKQLQDWIESLPQLFVALRGSRISARTAGHMASQLLFDALRPGGSMVNILNGPTNDVWITPWMEYLRQCGVDLRLNASVETIHCRDERVTGVTVAERGHRHVVEADYVVCALPAHVVPRLMTAPMRARDPRLARLGAIDLGWMNGVQYYLRRELNHIHGHVTLADSPWALTLVCQKQFWPRVDLTRHGDGTVREVLSVDVSEWDVPGVLLGKPARACRPEEIEREVWAQLRRDLGPLVGFELGDDDLVASVVDPALSWSSDDDELVNDDPLVVHPIGGWAHRPDATTHFENFVLAGDYVRTHTELACMEGACEAARRAVNGILAAEGAGRPCEVWPLREPAVLGPLRALDRLLFRAGLPHPMHRSVPASARPAELHDVGVVPPAQPAAARQVRPSSPRWRAAS